MTSARCYELFSDHSPAIMTLVTPPKTCNTSGKLGTSGKSTNLLNFRNIIGAHWKINTLSQTKFIEIMSSYGDYLVEFQQGFAYFPSGLQNHRFPDLKKLARTSRSLNDQGFIQVNGNRSYIATYAVCRLLCQLTFPSGKLQED